MSKGRLFHYLKNSISKQLSLFTSSVSSNIISGTVWENNCNKPPLNNGLSSLNAETNAYSSGIVVSLDIASSKVTAIVGRYNESKQIEILGIGEAISEGVIRGVISNINKTTVAVKMAISEASIESNVDINLVIAGISGSLKNLKQRGVLIRSNPNDDITLNDIEKLKNQMYDVLVPPGDEIIYLQPSYYRVDNLTLVRNPVGMCGGRLEAEFHIVTANYTAVKNLHKCIANAGVNIEKLYPMPIASAESILNEDEKEEGVVLIDIGASTTSLAVYKHGIIQMAEVIRLGGNSITEDVRNFGGVIISKAERLKMEFGNALEAGISPKEVIAVRPFQKQKIKEISRKKLSAVICARIEELIGLAYYSVTKSLPGVNLPFGLIITGGTSLIPNIAKIAENVTGLECSIGYPDIGLAPNQFLTAEKYRILDSPQYSAALGLLKMGLSNNF